MLPEGWTQEAIENYVTKTKGRMVEQNDVQLGLPYIGSVAFDGVIDFYTEDDKAVTCSPDELLILWDGEYAGKTTVGMKGAVSSTVVKLSCSDELLAEYLHYSMQKNQNRIRHVREGSGVPHMPKDFLRWYKPPLPPIEEQKKIVRILGSVDDAIEATQNVIDQTERSKKALMSDLLTRGIPGKHINFKPSPLGDIPESWEVTDLEKLADHVTSGSRGWAKYYADEGAAFVRITNLTRKTIALDMSDTKHVKLPDGENEGKRTSLQKGDVLISITADLGIIGYIYEVPNGEAYVNQHISLVRLKDDKNINSEFVALYLASPVGEKQLFRLGDTGAKVGLNLSSIRKTRVALPPVDEQKTIVRTANNFEVSLKASVVRLNQLQKLKTALMQVLLTGEVRFPLDNIEQEDYKEAVNG